MTLNLHFDPQDVGNYQKIKKLLAHIFLQYIVDLYHQFH